VGQNGNQKQKNKSRVRTHPPHDNVRDTGAQVLIAPALITAMLLASLESIESFKQLMTSTTKSLRDKVLRALVGKDGLTAAGHTAHRVFFHKYHSLVNPLLDAAHFVYRHFT